MCRIALALAISVFTASLWAATDSVAGTWQMLVQHDHGVPMALVLTQDGAKVKGTLTTPHGEELRLEGTLTDGRLALVAVKSGDRAGVEIAGALKDDGTLAGTISGLGKAKPMEWTAERLHGSPAQPW